MALRVVLPTAHWVCWPDLYKSRHNNFMSGLTLQQREVTQNTMKTGTKIFSLTSEYG